MSDDRARADGIWRALDVIRAHQTALTKAPCWNHDDPSPTAAREASLFAQRILLSIECELGKELSRLVGATLDTEG